MGGEFVLMLDDDTYNLQRCYTSPIALPLDVCKEHYVEDLTWLGLAPDRVHLTSEARSELEQAAHRLGLREPKGFYDEGNLGVMWRRVAQIGTEYCQYTPWVALAAVVDDHVNGVGAFVRGMDLCGEALLYDYLNLQLGWVPAQQGYCSLVRRGWGYTKETKSTGAPSVRALREAGVGPDGILDTLRELDWRRQQESRDSINIPAGILEVPKVPETIAWHGYT